MFLFKLVRRAIAFLLLLVIVIPVFALGKTWFAANNPTIRNGDVIVVLGAAQLDGRPGLVLEARLTEAKRIYDLGLAKKIITVGGGAPGDRTTEAAAGRIWLMQNGVKYRNYCY
jgi:vancomycin permeability regulator SanA